MVNTGKVAALLFVLGLITASWYFLGIWPTVVGVAGLVTLISITLYAYMRLRRRRLTNKYQDPEVVQNIMDNSIWQGQTSDQLMDAMGNPDDLDQKVLRTKKKEVWKYAPFGRNQYRLKIELEDDVVVAWEKT